MRLDVVKSVPRPMTTPAKVKSITGTNMAPPKRWIAFIMSRRPPAPSASDPCARTSTPRT